MEQFTYMYTYVFIVAASNSTEIFLLADTRLINVVKCRGSSITTNHILISSILCCQCQEALGHNQSQPTRMCQT